MSGNFEAKNYMYRKNKDGIIVGLVVHPNDVDAAFAALPIGARVMIGWAQIGDDEKPLEDSRDGGASPSPLVTVPRPQANEAGILPEPKKRKFSDYPLSAQCAMVCDEPAFHRFLELYLGVPYGPVTSSAAAATAVRSECRVTSRAELDKFPEAANAWRELYRHYQAYITDSKYAAVRR